MSARLLIIGLEATDLSLVERHIGEQRLPVLSALRTHGHLTTLAAGACATDAALWASFQYAAEVGEHGRYHDIVRLQSGRFGLAVQEEQERETIWDELSNHGMRVAVFDLPKSRAPKPINGIHLADWLVHGRTFPRPLSYPMSLAEEVVSRFGEAPPSRCGRTSEDLTDAQIEETLGHLRNSVSMKRAAALSYLEAEHWDCLLVNFKEMHCCSHGYWHLIDATHPAHDRARALRLGDPSTDVLQCIDRAIGDLVAAAGQNSEVIVFSTSGFQANGSASHLLPNIVLALNSYLRSHEAALKGAESNWVAQMLPYGENACALRVSRGSRGEQAAPGANRAMAIDALQGILQNLSNAATGEPIFEAFHRPSSDYSGSRSLTLPDMLLVPRVGVFPQSANSPELGCIASDVPRWRPGNHRGGGFVIARGSLVEQAAGAAKSLAQLGQIPRNILLASKRAMA
ncbi:MAG TPA: alkaline phosphatase family protein [Steroidobacteraceae bacterium]|jgi:predicted AlkP superfamily phosphohydrolase/phosphomutase